MLFYHWSLKGFIPDQEKLPEWKAPGITSVLKKVQRRFSFWVEK